jgi:hypothetical protein
MKTQLLVFTTLVLMLSGCSSMYYGTMEKMGVHKREIMMDRVEEARDTQDEAKQQFLSAMEEFKSVINFKGGDLEKEYNKLNATLKKSESEAVAVHNRILAVEDVSNALFKEWRNEIKQFSSNSLRRSSQQKYDITEEKYEELIDSMKLAESKLEPVLVPLRDQVLFLKHNLNARAIAGLSEELAGVQANVDSLVRDMDIAIAQADKFIAALKE